MNFKKVFETPKNSNYFFGYYDKSPICMQDKRHLALKTNFYNRVPKWGDKASIGFFEINKPNKVFNKICETNIFNWQQANMLQWYGDQSNHIIYNNLEHNKYSSVLLELTSGNKTIFDISIYDISNDYSYALCIDHERHHWVRRGYSYDGISNKKKRGNIIKNDGIYKLNFKTKLITKLIDIEDLLNIEPVKGMNQASHYVEHIMISPDDKRFAFMHRWKLTSGEIYSRLFTCDDSGKDLYLLNDSGRMSHFCWINNHQLFGWGGTINPLSGINKVRNMNNPFVKILKSIYKLIIKSNPIDGMNFISSAITGDSYIIFNDLTKDINKVPISILNKDGHPSCNKNHRNIILTDTYPDLSSVASLLIYEVDKKKTHVIDTLKSIKDADNTPYRCDLHPKWSYSGKYISVDTMDSGIRGIYVYENQ